MDDLIRNLKKVKYQVLENTPDLLSSALPKQPSNVLRDPGIAR